MAFMSTIEKKLQSRHPKNTASDIQLASEYLRSVKIAELEEDYGKLIKERKDGRQVYLYVNRKQISAKSKEALMQKLYEKIYSNDNLSMNDLFPEVLRWKRDNTSIKGKTLKDYKQKWDLHFKDYPIFNLPLKYLTSKDFVQLFRDWTKDRTLTRKEFNNYKSILNCVFQYAITELEIIQVNPIKEIDMRQFPLKPPTTKKEKVFSLQDREKLIKLLEKTKAEGIDTVYKYAIHFDFYVTLRIGELKALKWENLRGNQLYVESQNLQTTEMLDDCTFLPEEAKNTDLIKGNTESGYRWLHLPEEAMAILKKVRQLNQEGDYIFMYEGKQLNTGDFNDHLKEYCLKAGVDPKDKGSHSIRFTVASTLYQSGTPLTEIQRMLGHSTLQMTLHYLRNVISKE